MPKFAVLDIGTNAVKFYVAEKNAAGTWSSVVDEDEVTRLGQGLHATGKISLLAQERTITAIKKFVALAKNENAKQIIAIGTMALRTATNASEFIDRMIEETGIAIEIITGEEEARLSSLAVMLSLLIPKKSWMIFDVGGGSTELILGRDSKLINKVSLNIGVVRLTEQILTSDPVTDDEYQLAGKTIEATFQTVQWNNQVETLIGVGATMTILGAMKHGLSDYKAELIHGATLDRSDVDKLVLLLKSKTLDDRKKIVGLPLDRADVILAGAMIVKAIMEKAGMNFVIISNRGVRHGLLIDRFG
jgi:exopolyphosphatase/guanosine-5'-triphosphate,3'-diphosphate pyrophosphatase